MKTLFMGAMLFFAVAVALLVIVIGGCRKASYSENPNGSLPNCPPDAVYCEAPAAPVPTYTINNRTGLIARVDIPFEVEAIVHHPDYRKPTRERVFVEKGSWIVPSNRYNRKRQEQRRIEADNPFSGLEEN